MSNSVISGADQHFVVADDGTGLAYRSYGPADDPNRSLLLVGGAVLTADVYRIFVSRFLSQLSRGDSQPWTVHVYDRRGRGDSGPQGENYSHETEISDLKTMLAETGAQHVLGHSLGGSIALHTAREMGKDWPAQRLSVYDPAINLEGTNPHRWVPAFAEAVNDGKPSLALARLRKGSSSRGPLARVPEPILASLMTLLAQTPANDLARRLLPTGVAELQAGLEAEAVPEDFAQLRGELFFATGGHSAEYFRTITAQLSAATGGVEHVVPRAVHGSIPAGNRRALRALADFHKDNFTTAA